MAEDYYRQFPRIARTTPLDPVYRRLLAVVNHLPGGRTCRLWRLGTGIFFYLSAIASDQDATAIRTFLPIDRRRGPAVGTSAGDFAVGQGFLELGDAFGGDLSIAETQLLKCRSGSDLL